MTVKQQWNTIETLTLIPKIPKTKENKENLFFLLFYFNFGLKIKNIWFVTCFYIKSLKEFDIFILNIFIVEHK